MGSICRQAESFELSNKQYQKSAEYFMRSNDSTAYYYALNNIAFNYAEQSNKQKTDSLISLIEKECEDSLVLIKMLETKADLLIKCGQYDSALYLSSCFYEKSHNVTAIIMKAQAFSHLGCSDSALFYAKETIKQSNYSGDIYNALYILSHDDSTLCTDDILELTSAREDVRFENYEPLKEKLIVSVQLLEQDNNRKSNLAWLYAISITIIIIGLIIWLYVWRKRRQHALLSQQIEDLTIKNKEAQDMQTKRYNDRLRQIQENCDVLTNSDNIVDSLQWKNYDKFCECVNVNFFLLADKLKATSNLNEKEIRFCVLVLIGSYTDKQMADILYYSYNSIRSTKRILAKKLGTTSANLRSFLIEKAAK